MDKNWPNYPKTDLIASKQDEKCHTFCQIILSTYFVTDYTISLSIFENQPRFLSIHTICLDLPTYSTRNHGKDWPCWQMSKFSVAAKAHNTQRWHLSSTTCLSEKDLHFIQSRYIPCCRTSNVRTLTYKSIPCQLLFLLLSCKTFNLYRFQDQCTNVLSKDLHWAICSSRGYHTNILVSILVKLVQ